MSAVECAILIPFRDRLTQVAELVERLLADLPARSRVVLVDDGSEPPATTEQRLQPLLDHPALVWRRQEPSRGPAAARNLGIAWCREQGVELVLLVDSDCRPEPGLLAQHIALHRAHPEICCIGGSIRGEGSGYWARIDGLTSWFTSIPESPEREVTGGIHLPTTNLSLKLRMLGEEPLFDPALRTGEDVRLYHQLRSAGRRVLFSPEPLVHHLDRTHFRGFFLHHWRWGLHTYAVRIAPHYPGAGPRLLFALAMVPLLPLYALYASLLNLRPWAACRPALLIHAPVVFVTYCVKGVAVIAGALRPHLARYPETSPGE